MHKICSFTWCSARLKNHQALVPHLNEFHNKQIKIGLSMAPLEQKQTKVLSSQEIEVAYALLAFRGAK